jgi:periplasmic divalent cation tolerance protein
MSAVRLVYVTAPSRSVAEELARAAVAARLAACANVLDGVTSFFHWDGALQRANEALLLLKTVQACEDDLTALLRRLHPYDCPCIVALPVEGGHPEFLRWVAAEVSAPSQ